MKEIAIIKRDYKNVIFVFEFYDRFAEKMRKVAVKEKTDNTVIFEDYYDETLYYVDIDKVNSILDYCYTEYFFKIILSGSDYYNKIKKISDKLEIEPPYFDLFFRSFFLAIKDRYYSTEFRDKRFVKRVVKRTVMMAHTESFDDLPRIDIKTFESKATLLLNKIESLGLLNYNSNDITQDVQLRRYFPISCDTFKFSLKKDISDNYEITMPMFDFLDLRTYLNSQSYLNIDLLTALDRTIQTLIAMSFQNVRFHNNEYSDNSYIKQFRFEQKIVALKKDNA